MKKVITIVSILTLVLVFSGCVEKQATPRPQPIQPKPEVPPVAPPDTPVTPEVPAVEEEIPDTPAEVEEPEEKEPIELNISKEDLEKLKADIEDQEYEDLTGFEEG
jgi:PBP1b-binding outer membrane lipoprotein LpoB